ncbi:MAG: hypothetical protein ACRCUX_16305 [Beijerinckiaceae bacterium]
MSQALLGCAPTDGLGWLLRFFGIQHKEGVGAKALESLAFSYRVAPREAWLSGMRNRMVMPMAGLLPESLRLIAEEEWTSIVRAGLFEDAAAAYAFAAADQQKRLDQMAATVDALERRELAVQIRKLDGVAGFEPVQERGRAFIVR